MTPGAYVGVAPIEDDGVDFYERMGEIHEELLKLSHLLFGSIYLLSTSFRSRNKSASIIPYLS